MDKVKDAGWIAIIAITIFFVNLGAAKLWDRDEPRNAGCAKEMLERGNYVTPIFNDELRDAKPVLLYWFIISAYQVFGVTEFAARFWSAGLAVGTVLCTYFIAQRLFDRRTGVLSAIILSTSLMFGVAARAATPDSILIFFGTASLAVFVAFAFPRNRCDSDDARLPLASAFPRSLPMALGMYGLMAMAVLAKGPIGFLMPTAIIGMYLLIVAQTAKANSGNPSPDQANGEGKWEWIFKLMRPFHPVHFVKTCAGMRLILATTVILLIAGPWYYAVGLQTDGEFLKTFFLKEHLGRSTSSFENHSGSIFYYPIVLSIGFFPWSIFALPILVSLARARRMTRPMILLLCWAGVQVGIFTLVQTKLPSYITPCYPALAIICGFYLRGWANGSIPIANWLPRLSFATLGIGGVALIIGISYAAVALVKTGALIGVIGVLPIVASLIALAIWTRSSTSGARELAVKSLATSAIAFSIAFFGWVLPRVSHQQQYDEMLSPILAKNKAAAGRTIRPTGSFECLEPSWVFYSDQPIYELVEYGEPNQGKDPKSEFWRPKPRPALKEFLVDQKGLVITRKELIPRIEKLMGNPVSIVARSPYFMKSGELVLIESKQSEPIVNAQTAKLPAESDWK